MGRYSIVESGLWPNPKTRPLTDTELLGFIYFLSNPHSNSIGCYVLPLGYIVVDRPNWSAETVTTIVSKLSLNGFIERDEPTGLTRIVGWFGHNAPVNPNTATSMVKLVGTLPTCRVKANLIQAMIDSNAAFLRPKVSELRGHLEVVEQRLMNGTQTVRVPSSRPEHDQEQEPTRTDHQRSADAAPIELKIPPSPKSSSGALSKKQEIPKYARRIEGGFQTEAGEFVSFEDAYWALKEAAAEKGIVGSVMGQLLKAHGNAAGPAYDALVPALKKDNPVSYVAKVIGNQNLRAIRERAASSGQGIALPGDPATVAPWVLSRRAAGEIVTWNPKSKYWEAGGRGYDNNENEVAG